MTQNSTKLFEMLDTDVTADAGGIVGPSVSFGFGTLISPDKSLVGRLRYGAFFFISHVVGELLHTVGHILSARQANAPMKAFHMQAPMPITVHYDDDIAPERHQMRAIGGPIASLIVTLVSAVLRPLTPQGSPLRDFTNVFTVVNGILTSAVLPFPEVDGSSLLKWELVKRGASPEDADQKVKQTNLLLGGIMGVVGLIFALRYLSRK